MADKKLTTWEVLRYKFPENEYVLLQEVSDASGYGRSRSLDYMLINLWQSRGLAVTGIEQKSNRGDWLKELKNPQKQENHFKYCDYFYLLTDKDNVAKLEEIPASWGWYHINDKQILKTLKAAPKLAPKPIERSLLCAMLRRAADKTTYVHRDSLESHIQAKAEEVHTQRNHELERAAADYKDLKGKVDSFEQASGIEITYAWGGQAKKIGETVKLIMNQGVDQYQERLERIQSQAKNFLESITTTIESIKSKK
jgi:hypothetical protein